MKHQLRTIWLIAAATVVTLVGCTQPATPAPTQASPSATQATAVNTPSPTLAKPQATAAAAPQPSSAAYKPTPLNPPVKVRYGSVGTLGGMSVFVALDKGYFKEEGIDFDEITFKTAGDMVPALSRGDLDVGSGAINAGLFNAIARDIILKLVSEPNSQEQSEGLVVRADLKDQIKDFKDLKGRKIAISGTANAQEITLETALKKGGLTLKDVDIQTMGFPDMLTGMANKAIDVADMTEPTVAQGVDKGLIVRWKSLGDTMPDHQVGTLMYSAKFAKENNEAAKRFMIATMRGGRDYYEFLQTGKGKDEIINAAIKHTTIKDRALYDKIQWSGVNPDMSLNTKTIKEDVDWYVQKGYIQQPPDLSQALDTSFIDYAVQTLGKYKR